MRIKNFRLSSQLKPLFSRLTAVARLLPRLLNPLLLMCIAAALYMRGTLFHIPYEYDELFTAVSTDPAIPFAWLYKNYLLVDVHPPLYNTLLWGWNHLVPFGPEIYLRLPSFFMGLAALLIAWFDFPKRFGKTARILFVSLLSCNLYTIAYSQHARSYMLVLLFAVPLTFLFVDMSHQIYTRKRIEPRQWLTFGAVSLLLCWSHYFGALLFGCFSILLAVQAVYYKRKLTCFVLVPAVVVALFLPWLIPNFIEQLHFERFAGNWWGNQAPAWQAVLCLLLFWTGSFKGLYVMLALIATALADRYLFRKKRAISWKTEQILLGLTVTLFVICVALISCKTYLFINRYFISLLPVVYLAISLFISPLLRKNSLLCLLVLAFLGCGMEHFWSQHTDWLEHGDLKMPTRKIGQLFRDEYPNKEMFVVAVEGFPPAAMPAMYGFYANRVYHLHIPVYELFFADEPTRNALLARQADGILWMPNCTGRKPADLSRMWKCTVYTQHIGTACFLRIE